MLCVFSSGTQVVARLIRPVTQTACALSWPAERKWKLRGAFSLARPGGAVRSGSGPPSKRASRCQESCCDPTGRIALRTTLVPSPRWLRAVAPATSTSRRHQPNGRHSNGSTWRTAWILP